MILLHVASVDHRPANGVSNVVPEHVYYQSRSAQAVWLNCARNPREPFTKEAFRRFHRADCPQGDISRLPSPFARPDLVVFHGIYFPYFIRTAKRLVRQGIPYVIVPHGSLTAEAQHSKAWLKTIVNFLYVNRFVRHARAIHYLTDRERESSGMPRQNDLVCGNGIRLIRRGHRTQHMEGKPSSIEGFQFTYIGRLDPYQKGLDILLSACSLIAQEMRSSGMSLALYGPDHEGGRKVVGRMIERCGIGDIVKLGDARYGEAKAATLASTDVFIHPSRFEGQPLAVMEALAEGLPVIATPGTNLAAEIVADACGWQAEFSPKGLAKTMLEAFASRDRLREMSDNARRMAERRFSWESVASRTLEAYRRLIGEGGGAWISQ